MAFIRCCFIAVLFFCGPASKAQTVYYPANSSKLLRSTAEDVAMLLKKAMPDNTFTVQEYSTLPAAGIIFAYDASIADNQSCKVQGNGTSRIIFSAAQDNGLCFGIYQYLQQLGFRFYQPGSIWEITPSLSTAIKNIDTVFSCVYKYKSWLISGGHNRWIMDNNPDYGWDVYYGENGHNWALYQRRNNMKGAYGFAGHRGDIITGEYLTTIKNNPCYVANYNGSRQANSQSVPEINNTAATSLWANTIEQKFTQYKNIIFANTSLYANQYRNFNYTYQHIGIEVPDGARWGNSKENEVCIAAEYPKESDQQFILANGTATKILSKYPDKRFQLYAYSTHADVPSSSIAINNNIDVQLIPTVYQFESSTNGLRNRWYNRSKNVSEYHYLNLSNWSGETPSFNWNDLKTTLEIAKEKQTQGIVWEASPAKFGSLPYLMAANNNLKDGIAVDSSLHEFCDAMFGGAAKAVFTMLQQWGDERTAPNKYKMQLYIQLMNTAITQSKSDGELVQARLRELKAYLHYMVLYFDLANDDQDKKLKTEKEAAVCIYLAKANKMQLVNSYYLIANIVGKYAAATDFYKQYNTINGTKYQNGNLPLLTADEIDNDFMQDIHKYGTQIDSYELADAAFIKNQFANNNIVPLEKINTRITYTNGINYYNKTTFNLIAPAAGTFSIKYTPHFEMSGKGYINFLVEADDNRLHIIKDLSLDNKSGEGVFTVNLPTAGSYVLTVVSKYKSAVDLTITTNGNYFYKKGIFLGNKTESYREDIASLPGYFYVPAGIKKLYFNVPNNFSGGRFATATEINKTFDIKNNIGNFIQPRFVTPKDSSLFYVEVPDNTAGTFWNATKMEQYNLQFVNTSNLLWYARAKSSVPKEKSKKAVQVMPSLSPNPSNGVFNCMQDGVNAIAEEVTVFNTQGAKVGYYKNVKQFDLSNAAAGLFVYHMQVNGVMYKGKLVKL